MSKELENEKPTCPFYGMHRKRTLSLFSGSGGNQCGLVSDEYMPCGMEMEGNRPDWRTCPCNEYALRQLMHEDNILGNKVLLWPPEGSPISFREHLASVMGEQYTLTDA
jgi:hypothetical protein